MAGNVDTIKSAFEAFHNGDAEGMKAAWTDDIRWEGSGTDELPGGGVHEGADDVLAALGSIRGRWDSFQAEPTSSSRTATRWWSSGMSRGARTATTSRRRSSRSGACRMARPSASRR